MKDTIIKNKIKIILLKTLKCKTLKNVLIPRTPRTSAKNQSKPKININQGRLFLGRTARVSGSVKCWSASNISSFTISNIRFELSLSGVRINKEAIIMSRGDIRVLMAIADQDIEPKIKFSKVLSKTRAKKTLVIKIKITERKIALDTLDKISL